MSNKTDASEKARTLGEKLRGRREERKLSLREVENATSIRVNFLQAIEEGSIAQVISGIYAQGFIKQYAAFLGFDGESLLKEHPEILTSSPLRAQNFAYGIGTLEMRNSHTMGGRGGSMAIWVTSIFGVLLLAWFFARYLDLL